MRLYFMRHGDAVNMADSDHARPLSKAGIQETRAMGALLARMGIQPAHIYTSPRMRAQETAQIVADLLHLPVETREELNFDFDLAALGRLIEGMPEDTELFFVGHNPSMSDVLRGLCGAHLSLQTAAVARVDLQPDLLDQALLKWVIPPKAARLIVD